MVCKLALLIAIKVKRVFLFLVMMLSGMGLFEMRGLAQNISDEGLAETNNLLLQEKAIGEDTGLGLVLDNSRTKLGRDFYELFYQRWNSSQLDSTQTSTIAFNQLDDLTIMIEELPSPGLSNLIQISVNDQLLWQQFMQPRMDALEYFAENAYETVLQYILNYQEIQSQLGSQDQKGTGVY